MLHPSQAERGKKREREREKNRLLGLWEITSYSLREVNLSDPVPHCWARITPRWRGRGWPCLKMRTEKWRVGNSSVFFNTLLVHNNSLADSPPRPRIAGFYAHWVVKLKSKERTEKYLSIFPTSSAAIGKCFAQFHPQGYLKPAGTRNPPGSPSELCWMPGLLFLARAAWSLEDKTTLHRRVKSPLGDSLWTAKSEAGKQQDNISSTCFTESVPHPQAWPSPLPV